MSPVTHGPAPQDPAVTPTTALARLTAASVPAGARARAAAAVSAVASAAAAGASDPVLAPLSELAASLGTPPEAPVPGTTGRYAAAWSAYLTGTAAVLAAGAHPYGATRPDPAPASGPAPVEPGSAPGGSGSTRAGRGSAAASAPGSAGVDGYAFAVAPAALAVAAERGARMEAVADAVAIGLEVARRVDAALGAGLGAFDRVATIGRLAAVAAAARVLGPAEEVAAHAYGIAGTQAAGFAALADGPAGALQIGKAAADAVEAAYLARDGYTAGLTGIEGRRGFAALLAPSADLGGLDLGPAVPDATGSRDGAGDVDLTRTAEDFITSLGGGAGTS